MILDIAAGVLIAAAIVGIVRLGASVIEISDKNAGDGPIGWVIVAAGVLGGAALVAWRLFH